MRNLNPLMIMKKTPAVLVSVRSVIIAILALLVSPTREAIADPATLLFQDDFIGGIPGWTAVQPAGGTYTDGPMLWQFDKVNTAFS